ncbi:huntingtin-interacting protein 1 isoform X1, partial [Lates japonicus]
VIKDSMRNKADLTDMSRMWGHLSEGYGKLCSIYLKLLITKMEFHIKNPFPGNLQMSEIDNEAGRAASTTASVARCRMLLLLGRPGLQDPHVNEFHFQLTVEMFDYLECRLNLFLGAVQETTSAITHRGSQGLAWDGVSRAAGNEEGCNDGRESSLDMSRSVSVTAAGRCRLAPLIQVILDSSHLYLAYTVKLLFKLHSCSHFYTSLCRSNSSTELSKNRTGLKVSSVRSVTQYFKLIQIPQLPENPPNFLRASALSETHQPVVILDPASPVRAWETERPGGHRRAEAVSASGPGLAEQNHLRLQAVEARFLKARLERPGGKAQANEQRYTKLKEKYTELVQSHADLLRKNAEVTRQMTVARAAQDEVEAVRKEMQEKVKAAQELADRQEREQLEQLQELQRQLMSSQTELDSLKTTMASSQQSSEVLSTQLATLESEKAGLVQSLSKVEAELAVQGEELEQVRSSLATERESGVKTAEALQNQLNEKESREQSLESQLVAARWSSLQGAVEEAEKIIQDSLAQIDDPAHISCTSSADYLASRCQASLDCMDRLHSAREAFVADNTGVFELLRVVTQCGHLVGDTIVQGSATSHMVPVEQADALSESVKVCGAEALALLGQMKQQDSMAAADNSKLKAVLEAILATAEKLRPRGLELQQGELGDLVEQEMAATSAAVESAAARIEEMLNKSRAVDTGIKMEVNERILASCTELMQAIKELILSSKDLQRDIVESGRGAASMKEFYAKNSRWTEGLISASKAVGWGATVMVDAADLVVQGKGKFEELMVCSHEIAASTAQLVAASKVKADKDSANLHRLQQASRGVTQATAAVVASTKSGKSQIEETDTMDFSSMTLTQIKRQEMDAQVLVLELETRLQKERERLGELRKKHYELAGVAEGWGEEEEGTG